MMHLGEILNQAGAFRASLKRGVEAELPAAKLAVARAAAGAAALLERFAQGAVGAAQASFSAGGRAASLLVQNLAAGALFTDVAVTLPDFLCSIHLDASMMELIFYFGRRVADGSYAPLKRDEAFFAVPAVGLLFAVGASPHGCALFQQAGVAHGTVPGARASLARANNGASAEGAAKLLAYREAGDGTERVGMCFLLCARPC